MTRDTKDRILGGLAGVILGGLVGWLCYLFSTSLQSTVPHYRDGYYELPQPVTKPASRRHRTGALEPRLCLLRAL